MSIDSLVEVRAGAYDRIDQVIDCLLSGEDLVGAHIVFRLYDSDFTRSALQEQIRQDLRDDPISVDEFTVAKKLAQLEPTGVISWPDLDDKQPISLTNQGRILISNIKWRFL